jgi:hypothetical protein
MLHLRCSSTANPQPKACALCNCFLAVSIIVACYRQR